MFLLAAAMFVLVVDTSLMNVSISAVVRDLDTTASGVQSAIALEALVSAAFILINSKVGDLIGRKRAYVLGLLAYAVGALAMTLAQDLRAIVIFWAIIGGLGASLLLPAMQSLIHGNFAGAAQKQAYALVGAAAAIAAAIGPLLGGFVTTYLSWRVGFGLEVVIIAVVLSQIGLVRDVAYTGSRQVDVVGAVLSVFGMGGVVLGILVWQEGGELVGLLMLVGAVALGAAGPVAHQAQAPGPGDAARPGPVPASELHRRRLGTDAAAGHAGRGHDRPPAVLPDDAGVRRAGGRAVAGSAVADHVRGGAHRGQEGRRQTPGRDHRAGFLLVTVGIAVIIPFVPRVNSGWYLVIPLAITGCGLGLLVSQLNNYTLAPVEEERVSEAAGVNSAAGSFGLSFGLAMAGGLMLAALSVSFTHMTENSHVIPTAEQHQIATALEDDAEVMSNSQLAKQITGRPAAVEAEVLSINSDARNLSLQIALLVPLLAGLLGLGNSFRMLRLPTTCRPPHWTGWLRLTELRASAEGGEQPGARPRVKGYVDGLGEPGRTVGVADEQRHHVEQLEGQRRRQRTVHAACLRNVPAVHRDLEGPCGGEQVGAQPPVADRDVAAAGVTGPRGEKGACAHAQHLDQAGGDALRLAVRRVVGGDGRQVDVPDVGGVGERGQRVVHVPQQREQVPPVTRGERLRRRRGDQLQRRPGVGDGALEQGGTGQHRRCGSCRLTGRGHGGLQRRGRCRGGLEVGRQ